MWRVTNRQESSKTPGGIVQYLCLIYHAQTVPDAAVLICAQDLNQAIQRLQPLLELQFEAAEIWRLSGNNFASFSATISATPSATAPTTAKIAIKKEEKAMKYLCLVYSEEEKLHSLPDSPQDSECNAYAQAVAESGCMLAAEALETVENATTVRMRNGKISITDGPFAETKEQLAGFYLLDAPNLDQALEIAAGIPAARVGSVEVRPVRELEI
jgi:hypothetical protein